MNEYRLNAAIAYNEDDSRDSVARNLEGDCRSVVLTTRGIRV